MRKYISYNDDIEYTDMLKLLYSIGGRDLKYKWLITDITIEPQNDINKKSFVILSTEELLNMREKENFKWSWGVFSAIPDKFSDEKILKYALPYARENNLIDCKVMIQHPLAEIEIVARDSKSVFIVAKDNSIIEMFKKSYPLSNEIYSFKDNKKINFKLILLIIVSVFLIQIFQGILITGLFYFMYTSAKVEVNEDITKYNDYIGDKALENYRSKWGMDESIFPSKIKNNMEIKDYKMVYYNPWDAQYLSYLDVLYNEDDYFFEVNRLNEYKSSSYDGIYGARSFNEKYDLLAINSDPYYGFIYALTDKENYEIIYVEIIFCNYFMDLDYKKYINEEFLPVGFDATSDNSYSKKMLKN